MKRCPSCGTTYTDATLKFCLADGGRLEETYDSDPTLVAGSRNKLLVDIPTNPAGAPLRLHTQPPPSNLSSAPWIKILLAVFGLGVLLIGVIGVAGAIYYFSSGTHTSANVAVQKSPTANASPAPSATADEEKKRLEDELANVKRRLDEANKKTSVNSNPFPESSSTDADPTDSLAVATVNSPNDGFLALRTEPDPDTGTRIAKIPDGAQVAVALCQDDRVTIGGRTGKWCLVGWGNYVGWVFDAFLVYNSKN